MPVAPTKANNLFRLAGDAIIGSFFLPPRPIRKWGKAPRMLLPSAGAPLVPRPWVRVGCSGGPASPSCGRGGPQLRSPGRWPRVQARPIHHRGPQTRSFPAGGRAALPRARPGSRHPPPAHPAPSVNFWVNSVSPPDLPFTPDKHESVNRASEGPRGLLTRPAPPSRTSNTWPHPSCC